MRSEHSKWNRARFMPSPRSAQSSRYRLDMIMITLAKGDPVNKKIFLFSEERQVAGQSLAHAASGLPSHERRQEAFWTFLEY